MRTIQRWPPTSGAARRRAAPRAALASMVYLQHLLLLWSGAEQRLLQAIDLTAPTLEPGSQDSVAKAKPFLLHHSEVQDANPVLEVLLCG